MTPSMHVETYIIDLEAYPYNMIDHFPLWQQRHEADTSVPVSTLCCSTLQSGILSPTDYGTTIKSLYNKAVTIPKSLLSHNRVLQIASMQIALEEANLHRPDRSTPSQLRSSFCSSPHSYGERIGLVPSPLCPSCGLSPHTTIHVFSCSSHPTLLTEFAVWERPRLASQFLSSLPFFDLLPLPPPRSEPPISGRQESQRQNSLSTWLKKTIIT